MLSDYCSLVVFYNLIIKDYSRTASLHIIKHLDQFNCVPLIQYYNFVSIT